MLQRRKFLVGLGAMLAAPAIVHAGNLMPIRGFVLPSEISMHTITNYSVETEVIDRLDILFSAVIPRHEWTVAI